MTRIMIADDNEQSLYLLEAILKAHGYEVMVARNGAEALERAQSSPPDLIVTDILMPVMDGFELCRRWRAQDTLKDIPLHTSIRRPIPIPGMSKFALEPRCQYGSL